MPTTRRIEREIHPYDGEVVNLREQRVGEIKAEKEKLGHASRGDLGVLIGQRCEMRLSTGWNPFSIYTYFILRCYTRVDFDPGSGASTVIQTKSWVNNSCCHQRPQYLRDRSQNILDCFQFVVRFGRAQDK